MFIGHIGMNTHRVGSFVLLGGGVFLVFAGLTSALGLSVPSVIASAAAIAALLYAGAVWFGPAPRTDASVVLFSAPLTVAAGPYAGRPLIDLFPIAQREAIAAHCRVAFDGQAQRFTAAGQSFEVAPVRSADGTVVYGVLIAVSVTPAQALAG
jgi:hypothetical protein